MALGKCRECGRDVAKSAATCPGCGVKSPVRSISWTRIGLGVVGVLVLARVCARDPAKPVVAETPVAQAVQQAPSEQLVKVSAGALLQAYRANEAKFDQQYKGKRVEVSGTIAAIKTDLTGDPQIWLGSDFEPVVLNGHSKEWAATLKVGQTMTDKCSVTAGALGSVVLDCSH